MALPKEKLEALQKQFAVFDQDELPTPAQVQGIFKAIGQDIPEAAATNMINYVKQDRENAKKYPLLSPDAKISKGVTDATETDSPIMRDINHNDCLYSKPEEVDDRWKGIESMGQLFLWACKEYKDINYVGTRETLDDGSRGEYKWKTFGESLELVKNIGAGLQGLIGLKKDDFIGVNMKTREEWTLTREANHLYGLVTVTLYTSYGDEAFIHILNQTEAKVVITERFDTINNLTEKCPNLKYIIVVGGLTDAQKAAAKVKTFTFEEVVAHGKANPVEFPKDVDPSKPGFICYTSGTTGTPKGVMHSQKTLLSVISGLLSNLAEGRLPLPAGSVHLAFLPLAHVYEMALESVAVGNGWSIAYYQGNPLKLLEDAQVAKPALFTGVPRLLNKIYNNVVAASSGLEGMKKILGGMAVASKKKGLAKGRIRSFWDFIVFNKVKNMLGGNVKIMITASAPISAAVLGFIRMYICCDVKEFYGLSEAIGTGSVDVDFGGAGAVGKPLPNIEVKLISVPEMNYLVTDKPQPRGEICFRGPSVMLGYYKEPERTKAALGEDGWFRSGDIGTFTANGALRIVDRRKNIFKLSQGEYVCPEKCENIYVHSPFVAQSLIWGSSLKNFCVATIVLDPEAVGTWAKKNNIEGSVADLCKNEKLNEAVLASIDQVSRKAGLNGYEIAKKVVLLSEPFSVENGLLTPTFKLKRFVAQQKYMEVMKSLYD